MLILNALQQLENIINYNLNTSYVDIKRVVEVTPQEEIEI